MRCDKSRVGAWAAVCALGLTGAMVCPGQVWADDTAAPEAQPAAETAPATAPATPAPLMLGLDQIGLAKPLNDINLNIYGFVEAGFMYDFSAPSGNTVNPRTGSKST